jgi:hypothetical protein
MNYLTTFKNFQLNEGYLQDMVYFGLTRDDIDDNGYVTLYHGGKKLPVVLNKDEIFFMTPSLELAQDYAAMRKGQVFTLKVKPEDVHWNQGSQEVEYDQGGKIINGVIYPPEKKTQSRRQKGGVSETEPWTPKNANDRRRLAAYKNVNLGDTLPKSGWIVLDIIQHANGQVQFQFTGDRWYNANTVLKYEFGE